MTKKILIVTDFYDPHKSGIVTYINQITNLLVNHSFQITVLTTKINANQKSNERIKKINIIRADPTFRISRGFYSFSLLTKFLKIRKEYDIININIPLVEILPLVFFLKKKQTIITYHCLPEFNFIGTIIKLYFYFFGIISIFKSKYVIVLSKEYFNNILFHSLLNKNIVEIPPFIPINNIGKKIKYKDSSILNIGYLGRLSYEKGLELLIKVSNSLQKQNIPRRKPWLCMYGVSVLIQLFMVF